MVLLAQKLSLIAQNTTNPTGGYESSTNQRRARQENVIIVVRQDQPFFDTQFLKKKRTKFLDILRRLLIGW